jgi:hypothetical protein
MICDSDGGSTYNPTLYYQLPAPSTTAFLPFLTHYRILIWYPSYPMSISTPNAILYYPLLLPPAPKCLHMHQFCRHYPENYFLTFSVVYLSNLYNTQATRPVEGIYGASFPLHILFMCLLCTLFGLKFIFIYSYIPYLCKLQGFLTPESPGGEQRMPGSSPGSRRTNQEGGSPNWVE